MQRRYPIGAEPAPDGVHFRVCAPERRRVQVVVEGAETAVELEREESGYFSGLIEGAQAGLRYRFRLDGAGLFPDPASRFQPDGPHAASEVIDPSTFPWRDASWPGVELEGQVIYEMHIGTFTLEGTWQGAKRQLPELAEAGITVLEIMPIADFPGRFGWGYDGVLWFSPVAIYGRPDDFRAFVNEAHHLGVGVILDVVYNHIGPDGNYLKEFSEDYFTTRYANEWGEALNFDGENACALRELVATNAAYWAEEFHLDGLRLDATQQIFDSSPRNIMTELADRMRAAAGKRKVFIVAENESQQSSLARPVAQGGLGLDGLWNDDFHHSVRVALTGRREAYYTDYAGKPQELISAVKHGYLYQGQHYQWQSKRRGEPTWGLEPWRFVTCIENHDQIANSGRGERLAQITSPGRLKAVTAFLLLAPGTPMLFQGQEFGSSKPFLFFADHNDELRRLVNEGRLQFLSQFPSLAQPDMRRCHLDPGDPATFECCKLDFSERETHAPIYQLHKDLLRLRRDDPVFRTRPPVEGAVLGNHAFVLRFFGRKAGDRLLLINLGPDLHLDIAPEPLLAPPHNRLWSPFWTSEDFKYGGCGTQQPDGPDGWRLPAESAIVMGPDGVNPWD
ncbi:MAG: malto-oligosyltrehalose trehalohydrolase [Bryobacteraceae bacterium]|jgi:maltooligosyltrehalose trehalohydrolase